MCLAEVITKPQQQFISSVSTSQPVRHHTRAGGRWPFTLKTHLARAGCFNFHTYCMAQFILIHPPTARWQKGRHAHTTLDEKKLITVTMNLFKDSRVQT